MGMRESGSSSSIVLSRCAGNFSSERTVRMKGRSRRTEYESSVPGAGLRIGRVRRRLASLPSGARPRRRSRPFACGEFELTDKALASGFGIEMSEVTALVSANAGKCELQIARDSSPMIQNDDSYGREHSGELVTRCAA